MSTTRAEAGSYRDPGGRVYILNDRVFRTVMPSAAEDYEFVNSTGALMTLVDAGMVIADEPVSPDILGPSAAGAAYVLEHPRLPFVSYPYEWPFEALKAAALLHLDVHLRALGSGVTLSDATAYNVQFWGSKPIFIDRLSFRRYREGELWIGHRQFCEQFLNPLLLRAYLGIPHNAWYRGSLEGIAVEDFSRIIPLRRKFSWNTFAHVVLQASFQKAATRQGSSKVPKKIHHPMRAYRGMLESLRKWIAKLEPADRDQTMWSAYAQDNTYSTAEAQAKSAFVAEFAAAVRPALLWDIGCNTGDYSKVALAEGADYSVGFDLDHGALNTAFTRAQREHLRFLPLFLDVANPPPNQGWAETERAGLFRRARADAILALALVHHLAIAKNVPLDQVVHWLVSLARAGVIEFVPKTDPMVKELLRFREDIFPEYTEEAFSAMLESRTKILKTAIVSGSGRTLYWYERP